jgi:hypothetical protein
MSIQESSGQQRIRLFPADLTKLTKKIVFKCNEYIFHMQLTCYGDFTLKAVDFVELLTESSLSKNADHLARITQSSDEFAHKNKQLRDNIQVSIASFFLSVNILEKEKK